jgi:hypothetical protein
MAELFGVNIPAINKHLSNIFKSGELKRDATVSILETVQKEGKRQVKRKLEFLHNFLELSNYPILQDKGRITALEAKFQAEQEYGIYRVSQDINYISDFDREIKRITGKKDDD